MNSAGLRPKMKTFKKVIAELGPSVFFLEVTKFKDAGKFKFDNYDIFELVMMVVVSHLAALRNCDLPGSVWIYLLRA